MGLLLLEFLSYKDFLGGLLEPIAYAISRESGHLLGIRPARPISTVRAQMLRIKKIVDGKG